MFTLFRALFHRSSGEVKFGYEERKYFFGVLVLVFFMTVVLLMLGERALSDLSDGIPHIPYPYEWELPEVKEFQEFERDIYFPLQQRRAELEQQLGITRTEYDSSLLEKLAREPVRLYGGEESVRVSFQELSQKLQEVNAELVSRETQWKQLQEKAKEARKAAFRSYERQNRWRQLRVFVWEALFWVPFFLFGIFFYTNVKRRESKWELPALSVLIAASLLSLQSICVLLWSFLPREFLEWLWRLIRATLFTRVVGYDLFIALTIFLLGGLIVSVHRKLSDPVRFGKRRIRRGLCPTCSYPLALSDVHCGGCGASLRGECPACKKMGYTWSTACVYCGASRSS